MASRSRSRLLDFGKRLAPTTETRSLPILTLADLKFARAREMLPTKKDLRRHWRFLCKGISGGPARDAGA